jgi:hypothetical protein
MGSIIIIGDIHGHTKQYQKFLRQNFDPDQRSIQIGDMGIGFSGVGLHEMPDNHKWFRGNHDDPAKCRQNKNYLGDYGYLPEDKLFYLAGAYSIDRAYRTIGISWWADEELSYKELGEAVDLYRQVKPRFVLSHEAPANAAKTLLLGLTGPYFSAKMGCSMSRTAEALQLMLDSHQPEQWIFGHYHVDKEFQVPGYDTKFRCVGGVMGQGDTIKTCELRT